MTEPGHDHGDGLHWHAPLPGDPDGTGQPGDMHWHIDPLEFARRLDCLTATLEAAAGTRPFTGPEAVRLLHPVAQSYLRLLAVLLDAAGDPAQAIWEAHASLHQHAAQAVPVPGPGAAEPAPAAPGPAGSDGQRAALAAGARWCGQHDRAECAKHRRGGATCHAIAVTGADACRNHAGLSIGQLRARAARRALAAADDPSAP